MRHHRAICQSSQATGQETRLERDYKSTKCGKKEEVTCLSSFRFQAPEVSRQMSEGLTSKQEHIYIIDMWKVQKYRKKNIINKDNVFQLIHSDYTSKHQLGDRHTDVRVKHYSQLPVARVTTSRDYFTNKQILGQTMTTACKSQFAVYKALGGK